MALLQFLGRTNALNSLKLKEGLVNNYPYCAAVNRVIKHDIDPFIVETPVPTIHDVLQHKYNNQTLEELCLERATYLRNLPQKKFIMYSGGIDSTLALISIIKTHSLAELENVYICASSDSIKEFPEFWNDIARIFKGRIQSSHQHVEVFLKQGIVITGELGDQITGSDVAIQLASLYGEEVLFQSFEPIMTKFYNQAYGPNRLVENFKPTITKSLYPITTAWEWVWWVNFTNKWNSVKYRMLQVKGWEDQKNTFRNVHHFYDTLDFQIWSMHNPDKKIKNNLNSYKFVQKKIITDYTGYLDYGNKPKVPSLGNLWQVKGINEGIDTNFNFLTREETIGYINK